jgi:uncharacterized membrane protein
VSGFLRVMRLLAIVIWVGGLVFFAFVVAPVSFHVLPTTHEAGMVVASTLGVLNRVGLLCGSAFIFATILLLTVSGARTPRYSVSAKLFLASAMIAATLYVQYGIVPVMERDRIAAGGDVDAAPADNPARLDFERLHPISEKVEGAALLMGLGVVVLMGLEKSV